MSTTLTSEQLAQRWEFVAGVASRLGHDLSNIFTGVNGFAELAMMQLAHDHPARAYVDDVHSAGRRGIELSQRLHLLRSAGTAHPNPTPVAPILAAIVGRFRPAFPSGLRWETAVDEGLPPVCIERDPLTLVLAELLLNAAEACAESGAVRIDASSVELGSSDAAGLLGCAGLGPHVELRITDDGPGVAAGLLKKILEVPMETTKVGHRGLGLPIVFRALYAHRGGFTLGPAGARGSVARVCLPAC